MFAPRTPAGGAHAPYRQGAFPRIGGDRRAQRERTIKRLTTREKDRAEPDDLLPLARYFAARRLRNTRRDERLVQPDTPSAHAERRCVLTRLVEPGRTTGNVQLAG